jgi:hypothetical protein
MPRMTRLGASSDGLYPGSTYDNTVAAIYQIPQTVDQNIIQPGEQAIHDDIIQPVENFAYSAGQIALLGIGALIVVWALMKHRK